MNALRRRLGGHTWEALLIVLIVAAAALNSVISPYYLDLAQILNGLAYVIIPGLVALGLAVIVLQGEIDISIISTVAVGTVLLGFLSSSGVPYFIAAPLVVLVGALLGLVNGVVVSSLGLPSLAVTFGTFWMYRGIAYLIPGGDVGYAASAFQPAYLWLGHTKILGVVPLGLVLLAIAAVGFSLLVNRTIYGRWTYAIGNNIEAARFSGVRVGPVKIAAYVLAGVMAAIGALVFVGQYQSARGDNFDGQLLFVVAAVVLGGIDLNGGRGQILGVVLSILLLGTLYNGMGLANVDAPLQVVVFGVLLIVSGLIPRVVDRLRVSFARRRRRTRVAT